MLPEFFGIEAASERSGPDEIAKHDGELATLGVPRSIPALCAFRRGRTHSLTTTATELVAGVVDEPTSAARE
jgi:hypothetical protein